MGTGSHNNIQLMSPFVNPRSVDDDQSHPYEDPLYQSALSQY